MFEVKVRHAAIGDLDVLVRFNAAIAKETEGRNLDMERLRKGTRAVLESSERGYYLVAETESVIVGQLFVTYEWSDWRNGMFCGSRACTSSLQCGDAACTAPSTRVSCKTPARAVTCAACASM